jgi:hypothetical protein
MMVRLTFTQDGLPTPEEFERMLEEAMEKSNPVDELLELTRELCELEREFGMKSADFYEKYQRGEMGDSDRVMHWAIVYHSFLEHKRQVETALMREAVWRSGELVPA